MSEPAAPKFVMYVRAVEGRAVHRWGSVNPDEMFGARRLRLTAAQKAAGEAPIVWDTERVVPIDEAYARRFRGELERAIRNGDLKREDEKAYAAWLKIAEKRLEAEAEERRQAEEARKQAEEEARAAELLEAAEQAQAAKAEAEKLEAASKIVEERKTESRGDKKASRAGKPEEPTG